MVWYTVFFLCITSLYIVISRSIYGEGNGTPLQYSCLENPMDGGAWWAAVHGVAKSQTWLSNFTFTFHFHTLGKEMATHSSVLAWRIPGMGEPCGLLSMGSHRVGHNWRDLAAAAAAAAIYLTLDSEYVLIILSPFISLSLTYWATISNPERWHCESATLNIPANLENSAMATELEKVSFHSNPRERQ